MSTQANAATVRAYVDALNRFDMTALDELFTPDTRVHGPLGAGGLDVVEPVWRELHFSMNMRLEILSLLAEGDQVAIRLRDTGRFTGAFRGLPDREPTGRSYEIVAMEWFVLRDGRIAERWGARDPMGIARQVLDGSADKRP